MSVYLDTSCLLKLLREEPESEAARSAVTTEQEVVISSLVELETEVQLKAAAVGGRIRLSQWRQYQTQLTAMRNYEPFQFQSVPPAIFSTALKQNRHPRGIYCRTLDRLHLAAMEELNLKRLMTFDDTQAHAARALNFRVTMPGTGEGC